MKQQYIEQATALRKTEKYKEAIKVLDSALLLFKDDPSILLFKGDLLMEAKDFGTAVKTLKIVLPTDHEKTITQINLSYALFMNHKPELALQYARNAWENDKLNVYASVNYFNAMLWNLKTKEAGRFLKDRDSTFDRSQRLVLRARLHMTSGHFINGLKYYDSLIRLNPDKNYIREYAEVLLNKQEIDRSILTFRPFRVVPGREILEALGHRELAEDPELHLAVAHHVRIRGDALAVTGKQVVDDPVAIFLGEAEDPELDPEGLRPRTCGFFV